MSLPDIDKTLMALMGFGQAGYLGKKLIPASSPKITGIIPGSGNITEQISLIGVMFGNSGIGNVVTVDNKPISASIINWKDSQINFTLPGTQPNGAAWNLGQVITVGVIVNGQPAANSMPFTIC